MLSNKQKHCLRFYLPLCNRRRNIPVTPWLRVHCTVADVVADKRFICNHLPPICNHTTHRGTARYAERWQMADKNGKNVFLWGLCFEYSFYLCNVDGVESTS